MTLEKCAIIQFAHMKIVDPSARTREICRELVLYHSFDCALDFMNDLRLD